MERPADDELRIYIIVRRDIGDVISKAKFGVQVAHATLTAWAQCIQKDPERAWAYFSLQTQAKIVLQVKDGVELLALVEKAKALGFDAEPIIDAARTEFAEPTLTSVAIGPLWYKSEGLFLKRVRLYQKDIAIADIPPPPRPSGPITYTLRKGG